MSVLDPGVIVTGKVGEGPPLTILNIEASVPDIVVCVIIKFAEPVFDTDNVWLLEAPI